MSITMGEKIKIILKRRNMTKSNQPQKQLVNLLMDTSKKLLMNAWSGTIFPLLPPKPHNHPPKRRTSCLKH